MRRYFGHPERVPLQFAFLVSICLVAIVVPAAGRGGPDGAACSDATLRGAYAIHATGDVLGIGPFAGVGVFRYDGAGHVAGTLITRTNGANGASTFTGTYAVTADCFAADTLTTTTGAVSTHSYSIADGGRAFNILNTTVGAPNVIIGEGRRTGQARDDE
jgi:hypothetical protein